MKTQYQSAQRGATLIVVLFILLLVTILGATAIRQSIQSLAIAMNSQAIDLLRQGSDSVMLTLEQPSRLNELSTSAGLLGFIRRPENMGKELVFCFKEGKRPLADVNKASLIYKEGNTIRNNSLGIEGYCDPTSTSGNFFTSKRRAVLTQVAIRRVAASDAPFSNYTVGTDFVSAKTENNDQIVVSVISILPSLSNASLPEIKACLQTHMSVVTRPEETTITQCLNNLNVPYNTQVATYKYMAGFDS